MRNRAPCLWRLGAVVAAAAAIGFSIIGCGATGTLAGGGLPVPQLAAASACEAAPVPADAGTLVVIDWDGGASDQVPGRVLAEFSVDALSMTDAPATDTPAGAGDLGAEFRAAVLARVQTILCALDPMDVAVIEGDAGSFPGATVVHITGDEPFSSGKQIGQANFDPCNDRPDDAVVIWGGALAARLPSATFGQWVNAFANTTAHEVGHTLGFSHPDEDALARVVPQPAEEVMRGRVTTAALLNEQSFLFQQETCPGYEPGSGSYRLLIDDLSD